MQCKYLSRCAFIVSGSHGIPFTKKMTRIKYCEGMQDGCALYNAYDAMDADMVPDDLWPNLEIRTLEMIERRLNDASVPKRAGGAEIDASPLTNSK